MADDVEITIGAAFDKLASSVDQAKGKLEEFGGAVQAIVAAFAASETAKFIDDMAQLGEHIERTSAILGVTTTQVQQLGTIAALTGGNADQMAMSMERMQLNLQRGQVATGAQAKALDALGLSAKGLISLSLDQQMNRIADAVSKFADGGTKTAIVMELLGRGGAQMIPILDQGAKGLDEWRERLQDMGTIMTESTVKGLAELDKSLVVMKASMTAASGAVAVMSLGLKDLVDGVAQSAGSLNMMASTGNIMAGVMAYLSSFIEILIVKLKVLLTLFLHFETLQWGKLADDIKAGSEEIDATYARTGANLSKVFTKIKDEYDDMIADVGGESVKPQAPALDFGASGRMKLAMQEAQEEIKLNQTVYDDTKLKLDASVKMFQSTESQKTTALIDAIEDRRQDDLTALNRAQAQMAQSSADWKKLQAEKVQINAKADKDIDQANIQSAEAMQTSWVNAAKSMSAAFSSQLNGLLAGTETFGEAMKKTFATVIESMIAKVIELIAIYATLEAISLVSGIPAPSFAAVAQMVGLAPKYAEGTPFVPQTGLAMLHEGEAVIPAAINSFASGGGEGGSGGGGGLTLNVSAMDAASFASALRNNSSALAQAIRQLQRNNPSLIGQMASRT